MRFVAAAIAVGSAVGLTVAQNGDAAERPRVVFEQGCCEGFEAQLGQLENALRNGAWRDAKWVPLVVWINGVPQPIEGEVPASPERGDVAASIRVTLADDTAERIDVLGVDLTSERARRVGEQVASGRFGKSVPYVTVDGCKYDIDAAAIPPLLDRLVMGGIPLIPTRLRPDYAFDVDWPALQEVDGRWLVSWRRGPDGAPRLLLAVEHRRDLALARAKRCLAQFE